MNTAAISKLIGILELLDQTVRQRHAGSLIKVQVVCFVNDDQIPRVGQHHSLVT